MIDVWDIATYDAELRAELDVHAVLVRNFLVTSDRHYREREASDHRFPYPENPFSDRFMGLSDYVGRLMEARVIRAWHYTRMVEAEVAALRRDGIHLSTFDTLQTRLAGLVAAKVLDRATADRVLAASPFHSDQRGSRANKFWMVSHPHAINDSGVELLLGSWGGEVAYFWQRDADLQALLRRIGLPRLIEIAVPMALAWSSSLAGSAVVAAYGRSLGCRSDSKAFDLFVERPLPASTILAVHTEGEPSFAAMANGYPTSYRSEFGD